MSRSATPIPMLLLSLSCAAAPVDEDAPSLAHVRAGSGTIGDLEIADREAGSPGSPAALLQDGEFFARRIRAFQNRNVR